MQKTTAVPTANVKAEMTGRYKNYDLLRSISMVAVIIIHVNWKYFGAMYMDPSLSATWVSESLINIVTRFSVPAFVMLSGAFNINSNNGNPILFFKKVCCKFIFPTAAILLILITCNTAENIITGQPVLNTVKAFVTGGLYNTWYVFMLVGLYFITPALVLIKKRIGRKAFQLLSTIVVIWAIVSQATTQEKLPYSIGVCFAFAGYYMMGSAIKEQIDHFDEGRGRFTGAMLIACLICIALMFIARYKGLNYYTYEAYKTFFSPATVLFSLLVFYIFGRMKVNIETSRFSELTLEIYLFHSLVLNVLYIIVDRFALPDPICIVILTICTLLISAIMSLIFDRLWKKLEIRMNIRERINNAAIWNMLDELIYSDAK